jgi:hypothetical protein
VLEVRVSLKPFYRVEGFNPGVLFNDIVGVTLPEDGKITKILVEAYGTQANYILTKPLHASQKVHRKNKNGIVFSYHLIPNFEFESKILTYADHVKVLKPLDIRNRVAARLIAAAMSYADDMEGNKKKQDIRKKKKGDGSTSEKKSLKEKKPIKSAKEKNPALLKKKTKKSSKANVKTVLKKGGPSKDKKKKKNKKKK